MIALAWAVALAVTSTVALARTSRAPRERVAAPGRVLLVRTCTGAPPGLADALRTLPSEWPSSARLIFTVADERDAARPITRAVAAALRREGVDAIAVVARAPGINRKVTQLVAALASFAADREVLVVADADVDLGSLDVAALWAGLASDAAACWAPPVELDARSFADRASRAVLTASLHAFPLLANLDRDLLVGKAFAIRLSALAQIGGLAPVAAYLGEDAALAHRLRVAGHRVRPAAVPVRSLARDRGWAEVFDRYVRWALVLRSQRTALLAAYPLLFAATPLVLALAFALGVSAPANAAACVVAIASRLAVAAGGARRCGRNSGLGSALVDALLADVLLLAAFARACVLRRVRWRDREMRLGADGRLQPLAEPTQHESRDRVEAAREAALEHRVVAAPPNVSGEPRIIDAIESTGDGLREHCGTGTR